MDYVLFSALRHARREPDARLPVNLTYDIVCQYHRNLVSRMAKLPDALCIPADLVKFRYFIPKFHLPAHGSSCQTRFSLNWNRHCGRTYAERTEQEWRVGNKLGPATLEMGPGARHATLDDQWGGWNIRHLFSLGNILHLLYLSSYSDAFQRRILVPKL